MGDEDAAQEGVEKRPPTACLTCHDAPTEQIEHNGLLVDHDQYLEYGASCESCHNNTTSTPQPIEDGRCLQCHTFGIDHAVSATEMHQIHAMGKHKIECFSCHGMVLHGPRAETMTLEQFDCRKCHINQHAVQQQAYLQDPSEAHGWTESAVGDAINPMFLAHVDCTACHVNERELAANPDSGATVIAASIEACDRCHQAGMGQQMVPLWQKNTRDLFAAVDAELSLFDGVELDDKQAALVEEARALLGLVRVDGSWGVHNPTYTQGLLERARERLAEAKGDDG